ncbi:hypothetical protein [Methanobrevibacter sp. V14]|uniref:hypothetical protein n=1 Tax=Methanobrevibacter sp. V14 TaxID=3064280 RepID=UPI0027345791|nr:hypothetical protein [Methanobrevibacter sp. V14]
MTENIENTEKIKIKEILEELHYLREQNTKLEANNKILGNELTYFKEQTAELEDLLNNLPKKYIHQVDESSIINLEDLVISLAELGDFTVYEVLGYNDEFEGYIMELNNNSFLKAELAAEQYENEICNAMASYGDDI